MKSFRSLIIWSAAFFIVYAYPIAIVAVVFPNLPQPQERVRDGVVVPVGSLCYDHVPAYFQIRGNGLFTGNNLRYNLVSEEECLEMCSLNLDINGNKLLCASVTFDSWNSTCFVHRSKTLPDGIYPLVAGEGVTYYEKFCLPPSALLECGEEPFPRVEQKIMKGHSQNVTIQETLQDCVTHCIQLDSDCQSAMYFHSTRDETNFCIVSPRRAEDSNSLENAFENDENEKVTYFENTCTLEAIRRRTTQRTQNSLAIEKNAQERQVAERRLLQTGLPSLQSSATNNNNIINNAPSFLYSSRQSVNSARQRISNDHQSRQRSQKKLSSKRQKPSLKKKSLSPRNRTNRRASAGGSKRPKKAALQKTNENKGKKRRNTGRSRENRSHRRSLGSRNRSTKKSQGIGSWSSWNRWSYCDWSGGRRVRRRSCSTGVSGHCRPGIGLEVQWCSDLPRNQVRVRPPSFRSSFVRSSPLRSAVIRNGNQQQRLQPTSTPRINHSRRNFLSTNIDDQSRRASFKLSQQQQQQSIIIHNNNSNHNSGHNRPFFPSDHQSGKTADQLNPFSSLFKHTFHAKQRRAAYPYRLNGLPAPEAADGKWDPWIQQCNPFLADQRCKNGHKIGYQSRTCGGAPSECFGPYFRYCFISC